MLGCLPILVQIPLLFALIAVLKYPTAGGINAHPHFLWFNLTEPEIFITIIAAVIYFIQPIANLIHYPKGQRTPYYIMMIASPIFISFVALHSASALGLYWTFSGLFLIIQVHFAHQYYGKRLGEKHANSPNAQVILAKRSNMSKYLSCSKMISPHFRAF